MKTGLFKTGKSAWVPLFLGALAAATFKTSWATKEVATNSFYVKIHADPNQPDLAHKIARRNGFHNLGSVSSHEIFLQKEKGFIGKTTIKGNGLSKEKKGGFTYKKNLVNTAKS